MTRRDMIDRFHGLMDSYLRVFWNDARATVLLNTIKDKIAQEFTVNRVEQYYTLDSVQGQENYEVPSTYVSHELMFFNSSYNREIILHSSPKSIQLSVADKTIQGIPSDAYIWGVSGRRQLTIYPTFNVDGLTIQWWFYGWPPDLAVDNDEPHFPVEWHPSIVDIMVAHQQEFDKVISTGDRLIIWREAIDRIRRMDVSKQLTSTGGQSGSFNSNFPSIPTGGRSPFTIQFPSGATERA